MERVSKTDLARKLAKQSDDLSLKESKEVITSLFKLIADELSAGNVVNIPDFGTFSITQRAERQGINPSTKAKITIPAQLSPKFKASKSLKLLVNN